MKKLKSAAIQTINYTETENFTKYLYLDTKPRCVVEYVMCFSLFTLPILCAPWTRSEVDDCCGTVITKKTLQRCIKVYNSIFTAIATTTDGVTQTDYLKQRADNIWFDLGAYFLAFFPWAIMHNIDSISEKWRTCRRTRKLAHIHLVSSIFPSIYAAVYAEAQRRDENNMELVSVVSSNFENGQFLSTPVICRIDFSAAFICII